MRIFVTAAFVAVSLGTYTVSAQTLSEVAVTEEDVARAQELVEAIEHQLEADTAATYRAAKALAETNVGKERLTDCPYGNDERLWITCMFDNKWEYDGAYHKLYDEFYPEELLRVTNQSGEEKGEQ